MLSVEINSVLSSNDRHLSKLAEAFLGQDPGEEVPSCMGQTWGPWGAPLGDLGGSPGGLTEWTPTTP